MSTTETFPCVEDKEGSKVYRNIKCQQASVHGAVSDFRVPCLCIMEVNCVISETATVLDIGKCGIGGISIGVLRGGSGPCNECPFLPGL